MTKAEILDIIKQYNRELDLTKVPIIKACNQIRDIMQQYMKELIGSYEIQPSKQLPYGRNAWKVLYHANLYLIEQLKEIEDKKLR